jgi:hypothetical protein
VYILHVAPGIDEWLCNSRADAFPDATRVAARERVRVWVTAGDYDFLLVEDFRAAASL